MSTKRGNGLKFFAKLKEDIFAEEDFVELSFSFYDPTHRNLSQKKFKKFALLTNNSEILKEKIQKTDMIYKNLFRKIRCFSRY